MVETAEKTYGVLLSPTDAAEILGVSLNTLRQWLQQGKIESHKIFGRRRISEDELIRIIEESRDSARSETRPRVNLPETARGRGKR